MMEMESLRVCQARARFKMLPRSASSRSNILIRVLLRLRTALSQ